MTFPDEKHGIIGWAEGPLESDSFASGNTFAFISNYNIGSCEDSFFDIIISYAVLLLP